MKVGIVTHNVVKGDGQGRVNYELTRAFLSRGIDVELFADRIAPDLLEAGATWTRIKPGNESINLLKVLRFSLLADKVLAQRDDPDLRLIACGFVTTRPHVLNVAHFVHGTWLHSPFHSSRVRHGINPLYQRLYTKLNARWELKSFAQAGSVIALSPMVERELIDIGVQKEKIKIIVNGVDLDEFRPGQASRVNFDLPEDPVLGLFVGDLRSSIKNLDLVLEGLVSQPLLHLAVVGDPQGSVYPKMAERLGLANRVHFLGFRRDVADIMRTADFFVLPSRRDSCPLALLEAMASGLPIITSPTVGTWNLVTQDVGMVIGGPDDIDGMKASLGIMASQPARVRDMKKASRDKSQSYSWQRMGDRYIGLLEGHLT